MAVRKAYFLDASYTVKNGETYVSLTLKGKRTVKRYYRYDPYFLVDAPLDKKEAMEVMETFVKGESISPVRVESTTVLSGLEKKKLLKVICKKPGDVPVLKGMLPFPCYEYSIPFAKRFIFDFQLVPNCIIKYEREGKFIKKIIRIEEKTAELETLAFDIETYNPMGIPREKKDPIIMISYCGKKKGVITSKKSREEYVETVDSEKEILERFSKMVRDEDPDVIFGYNSANFDIPYLQERARIARADFSMGRWNPRVRKVKKGMINGMDINGRVHMDLYPIIRLFGFIGVIKAQEFTLDSIASEVLGKRKVKMRKGEMWKLWDGDRIDELAFYSLTDSELTAELGRIYLPLEIELSTLTRMPLFDVCLSTSGQLVENLLMYNAVEKGMLIPPKPAGEAIGERINNPIKGAFVKLPEPGIYNNIAVLDFRGLYPSIIVSYNIDPDTITDRKGKGTVESPTGAIFQTKTKGLIPSVLDYLIDFRVRLKKKLKTLEPDSDEYTKIAARSQAVKILSNSFYGYLGYARSRWYSRKCAESVTAFGRKHIQETIEAAEEKGFEVLYGDTDSVFLIYKDKKKVGEFVNEINKALPGKMELELEGFYPRGVFVSKKTGEEKGAKKKYALIGEDGRIKIRGFELVRRDWSAIAKETQRAVLEAILKEGSREKAVGIVKDAIKRLKKGKVPMEELAIITQLNKDPRRGYEVISPELSAARKAMKAGRTVEKGSIISYVITKKGTSISDKAAPLEMAGDYDAEYYINNQVLPAVMKILKELGYDEYGLKVGGKQKGLESYF
jgi:DNA polymerase I